MIIKDIMSNYMCQQIGQYGISKNMQPSKTTPGKKQHLNRPTSSNETESVIKKKFPTNKDFTGEFHQTSKEKSAPVLSNYSQKLKRRECFPTHPMRPSLCR